MTVIFFGSDDNVLRVSCGHFIGSNELHGDYEFNEETLTVPFSSSGALIGDYEFNQIDVSSYFGTSGRLFRIFRTCTSLHAKTVIFDCANSQEVSTGGVRILKIEFLQSWEGEDDLVVCPLVLSEDGLSGENFTSYSTSERPEAFYKNHHTFNTETGRLNYTDLVAGTEERVTEYWRSSDGTNQRLSIVFDDGIYFNVIRLTNIYYSRRYAVDGIYTADTRYGVKDLKIYTDDFENTSVSYQNDLENATLIFDGEVPRHPGLVFDIVPIEPIDYFPSLVLNVQSDLICKYDHFSTEGTLSMFQNGFVSAGHFNSTPGLLLDLDAGHNEGYHIWGALSTYFYRCQPFRSAGGRLLLADYYDVAKKDTSCFYVFRTAQTIQNPGAPEDVPRYALYQLNSSLQVQWSVTEEQFFTGDYLGFIFGEGVGTILDPFYAADNYGNLYITANDPNDEYKSYVFKIDCWGSVVWDLPIEANNLTLSNDDAFLFVCYESQISKVDTVTGLEIVDAGFPIDVEDDYSPTNTNIGIIKYGRDGNLYLGTSYYEAFGAIINPDMCWLYKINPADASIYWRTYIRRNSSNTDGSNRISAMDIDSYGNVALACGNMSWSNASTVVLVDSSGNLDYERLWASENNGIALDDTFGDGGFTSNINIFSTSRDGGFFVPSKRRAGLVSPNSFQWLYESNEDEWDAFGSLIHWNPDISIHSCELRGEKVYVSGVFRTAVLDADTGETLYVASLGGRLIMPSNFDDMSMPERVYHKITTSVFNRHLTGVKVRPVNNDYVKTITEDTGVKVYPQRHTVKNLTSYNTENPFNGFSTAMPRFLSNVHEEDSYILHGQGIELEFIIDEMKEWYYNFLTEAEEEDVTGITDYPGHFFASITIDGIEYPELLIESSNTFRFEDWHPMLGPLGSSVRKDHHIELNIGWAENDDTLHFATGIKNKYSYLYSPENPLWDAYWEGGMYFVRYDFNPIVSVENFNTSGNLSVFYTLPNVPISAILSLLNEVGEFAPISFLSIRNGFGNTAQQVHPLSIQDVRLISYLTSLGSVVRKSYSIIGEIRGTLENMKSNSVQSFMTELSSHGIPFADNQIINTPNNSIEDALSLLTKISEGLDGNLSILAELSSHGDFSINSNMVAINSLGNIEKTLTALLTLSDSTGPENLNVLNTLSGDSFGKFISVLNTIEEVNYVISQQYVFNSIGDSLSVTYPTTTSSAFIDGFDLNKHIVSGTITISQSQSSIHNDVTITSLSNELFEFADPLIMPGTPRIELHIGNRVFFFLVEERSRNLDSGEITIWGRDQTARDSEPWSSEISFLFEEGQSASEFAQSVTTYSAVDWDILDWVLPEGYEVSGTPVQIISQIASEIGAIVRAQDDGSLLVRSKYPVAPIDLPNAETDLVYTDNIISNFTTKKSVGSHYNTVTVQSDYGEAWVPQIEVEDMPDDVERSKGTDSYLRVFWDTDNPSLENTYVTSGNITELGVFTESFKEVIVFELGVGSTTYPVYEIESINWYGDIATVDENEFTKYSKDIILTDNTIYRIAEVTYTIEYSRYLLSDHNVDELLAVFYFEDALTVNVTVVTTPISEDLESGEVVDKAGDFITTTALTSQSAVVELGLSWIVDNKYDMQEQSFDSPFNSLVSDGSVIWIDSNQLENKCNSHVMSATITVSGPKVINSLEVIKWMV